MTAPKPPDTIARALADLALGMSTWQVAAKYQVDQKTVRNWRARHLPESSKSSQKNVDVGELIASYIAEGITTLAAQARHFRDPAWLAAQNAKDLAINHGVLADKLIRILAALRAAPIVSVGPEAA